MPPEPDEAADPATVCVIPVTRITLPASRGKRTPLMLRALSWVTLESTDSPHPPAVSRRHGVISCASTATVIYAGAGAAPTAAASSTREVMPSLGKIRYRWLLMVRC